MCTCGQCSTCLRSETSDAIARGVIYTGSNADFSKKSVEEIIDILDKQFQQNVQVVEINGINASLKMFVTQVLNENKALKERMDELERQIGSLTQNLV